MLGVVKPVAPAGVRQKIARIVNSDATEEAIRDLLAEALNLQTHATAVCVDCGGEMRVTVRDVKKAADTLIALIEQSEGRPEQRQAEATAITIVRPPL